MTYTGDRPNYPLINQRFDKGDTARLQQLWQDTVTRTTGGSFGQTWGCLTSPNMSLRVTVGPPALSFIDIEACTFVVSRPPSNLNAVNVDWGNMDGQVITHDPDRATQTTSYVDVTAFAPTAIGGGGGAGGQRCWLLFKRQEAPTSLASKVYFDEGLAAESTAPANLVIQEYVDFAAVASVPSSGSTYGEDNGWYRFAYIADWSSPEGPTLVPIHWAHAPFVTASTTPPTTAGTQLALAPTELTSFEAGGTRGFSPSWGMPSSGRLLHWMLGKLSQHYSTASVTQEANGRFTQPSSGDGWMATPPRGLVELDADLSVVEAALPGIESEIDALANSVGYVPRVLQVVTYKASTGLYSAAVPDADAGFIVSPSITSLTHTLTINGIGAHTLYTVVCVPKNAGAFTGTDVPRIPILRETAELPNQFALTPTLDVEVRQVTPAGAGVDGDCSFLFIGRRS